MFRSAFLFSLACAVTAIAQPLTDSISSVDLQLEGVTVGSMRVIFFDGPGATQTYPSSINNNGTITGFYANAGSAPGFLRRLDGTFITFTATGAENIYPSSIDSTGMVAGNYTSTSQYGFQRMPNGNIVTFTVPGTFPNSSQNPVIINDAGVIAGPYFDGTKMHGFIRTSDGSFYTIGPPGSTYTYASGLNNLGAVTGIYADASYNEHGFVRQPDGTWLSFDVPGGNFGFFPPAFSINNSGEVTGSYFEGSMQGFTWQPGGPVLTFAVSGAAGTQPNAMNSIGTIVGSYQDTSYTYHGFLRTPSGTVYTFSVPGALGTYALGINDRGMIVGSYVDAGYASHGLLIVPSQTGVDSRLSAPDHDHVP
ncbi:MAG TPA: hypothetical protein VMT86_05580 [Bryobacteraceae bacterium]|nr:hypothetical protein [Bryobacteraceae bacterium]